MRNAGTIAAASAALLAMACTADGTNEAHAAGAVSSEAPAWTASAADGQLFAAENCAGCHAIGAGDLVSPNGDAPPFQTLARNPAVSRIGLAALLASSHKSMPNFVVEPGDVDNLYAYLETLR